MGDKPRGSGVFAMIFGAVYILLGFVVVALVSDFKTLPSEWIFAAWLVSAGIVVGFWGWQRFTTTTNRSRKVGQPTIKFGRL